GAGLRRAPADRLAAPGRNPVPTDQDLSAVQLRRFPQVPGRDLRTAGHLRGRLPGPQHSPRGRQAHLGEPCPAGQGPRAGGGSTRQRARETRCGSHDARNRGTRTRREREGSRTMSVDLDVKDVTVRFGGIVAVNEATVYAKGGRITGLIGPNGAGKTTFFNACT